MGGDWDCRWSRWEWREDRAGGRAGRRTQGSLGDRGLGDRGVGVGVVVALAGVDIFCFFVLEGVFLREGEGEGMGRVGRENERTEKKVL